MVLHISLVLKPRQKQLEQENVAYFIEGIKSNSWTKMVLRYEVT